MVEHPRELRRYVVLRHTGHKADHFDLMIEIEPSAALLTWRTPVWPLVEGAPLVALEAHRRDYLTYEGPVSGGRGYVRRVAAGRCRVEGGVGPPTVLFDGESVAWSLGEVARAVPRL